MKTIEQLRFPVGEFTPTPNPSKALIESWIQIIADFPNNVRQEVTGLNDEQLATPYRPGGWTVRQVVHHCADSHLNAFTRFKLALTEDGPNIKPYNEAAWAELVDTKQTDISFSISILDGLHARWAILLRHLSDEDLKRQFFHPEHGTAFSLLLTIDNYQWHCRHHLAHIRQALND